MKIALVCGHFIPSMGYLEVHLANEIASANHELQVFTSAETPGYVSEATSQQFTLGTKEYDGYLITRLPHSFSVGQMVKPKGLNQAVIAFDPELILVIGVGKLFPKSIYKLADQYPIYTLLGDNSESYHSKKSLAGSVKMSLKKKVYKQAVKHSSKLLSYTPETIGIVQQIVGSDLAHQATTKNQNISLGFDHRKFYPDQNEREATRTDFHLKPNDLLLITATRVVPEKKLETIVDAVVNYKGDLSLKYFLVGFFENGYCDHLKQYIQNKDQNNRITCLPFGTTEEIRKLYNAADRAYFPNPAISIFEALGCGLPTLLPLKPAISHILSEETGMYTSENLNNDLDHFLTHAFPEKDKIAQIIRQAYSYEQLVRQILA